MASFSTHRALGTKRRVLGCLLALGALMLVPTGGRAAAASGPDSHQQPLIDGCQRSDAFQLGLSTPEWVYVNRSDILPARAAGDRLAGTKTVDGVVGDIHPAGDDLYVNHDYNDLDIDVAVDPQFANVVATANQQSPPEIGTEWEATRIPTWAWPQVGDRVRESGSWIWDCGHWGNGSADPTGISQYLPYDPVETGQDLVSPGAITGEQTELHPLYQVTTWRKDAAGLLKGVRGARNMQRLDVWINGDGTPALAEEECALFGLPPSAAASGACPRTRDVGGHYSYTLGVGPGSGRIVINPVTVHDETDPALRNVPIGIRIDPRAGVVTVSFDLPHTPVPQRFGITVEAGWNTAPLAVRHIVNLGVLGIRASLDGSTEPNNNPVTDQTNKAPTDTSSLREQAPDPGEWVLYAAVNGRWWQVPPQLIDQVPTGGEIVTLNRTFDYYLPRGVEPTLFVSGRECDIPLIDCTKERFGAPVTDATHPFSEVGYNDFPGRIELDPTGTDNNVPLPIVLGTYTYSPPFDPDAPPGEKFSDNTCNGPCFTLTATAS